MRLMGMNTVTDTNEDVSVGTDTWAEEAELQKLHGMSPKEAHVYLLVEKKHKMVKDVADSEGMSLSTVKTYLGRARRKIDAASVNRKIIVIPRLPATDAGRGYKIPVIMKVGFFLAKCYDTDFHLGGQSYMIVLPGDVVGDVTWYKTNVATKIKNLVGGMDGEPVCREIGDEMASIVTEMGAIDKIGWGILKYHLDQMYVKYDVYED